MSVVARQGDLTKTHASAVVNAGNTSLWLGSGVAGAIRSAGGPTIQQELDRIRLLRERMPRRVLNVTKPGDRVEEESAPCELGEVVVTHAGDMHARYVLHAAVMDCKGSYIGRTSLGIVRMATVNCMLKVQEMGLSGITFPIFGTGVGGLDIAEATEAMLKAITDYRTPDTLIRLYGYRGSDKATIEEVLDNYKEVLNV